MIVEAIFTSAAAQLEQSAAVVRGLLRTDVPHSENFRLFGGGEIGGSVDSNDDVFQLRYPSQEIQELVPEGIFGELIGSIGRRVCTNNPSHLAY